MIFWLLYVMIDGQPVQDYPFHFAFKQNCDIVGKSLVKDFKYEGYKCIQEVRE
jgi:hypothetical protein